MTAENARPGPGDALEPRRLADYVVDKADRGRHRGWLLAWLLVAPLLRSPACPHRVRASVLRAFGATVGERCRIHRSFRVHFPWKLSVGAGTRLAAGVWVIDPEPVVIGENCQIDDDVVLCAGGHDHTSPTFTRTSRGLHVGRECLLGAGTTVLKGTRIADGTVIPPGSVVVARRSPSRGAHR